MNATKIRRWRLSGSGGGGCERKCEKKEGRRERIIGDEGRGGRLTLLTERKEIRKWKEREEGVESVGKNKKERKGGS